MKNNNSTKKLSFISTIKSILWAFFGVRKHSEYEKEQAHFNPIFVILAAVFLAILFVLTLILIINYIVL